MMRITFLGTGTSQGIPVIECVCEVCSSSDLKDKRLRVSVLIETAGKKFVIDTGPDFRQQMLSHHVNQLDAVLFTHEHKDHVAGLDDVRAFNYIQKRPMNVYATERVQSALKREFYYAFEHEKYPGVPQIELQTISNQTFTVEGVEILPIQVMHFKLPVMGFRIGDFTYITDANYIAPEEMEKIKGSRVLVLNALRREPHVSHFTLDEAIQVIQELQPGQAVLTHISHLMGTHREVSKNLPSNIHLAYDNLTVTI